MQLRALGQAAILALLVGALCGVASAIFLYALAWVTDVRVLHPYLVWLLPVAGFGMGVLAERIGGPVRGGTGLLIERVADDGAQVPARMGPIVLVGTILTHLFGGSAGREGTAVQMGGSLADLVAHRVPGAREVRRVLLVAGMAGGFGSVFGTPFAGAVFALEVIARGQITVAAAIAALIAAVTGDLVTRALHVTHTSYPKLASVSLSAGLLGRWILFSVAAALTTVAFIELSHGVRWLAERATKRHPLQLLAGGLAVVGLWQLSGTTDYLGLGVPSIVAAYTDAPQPLAAFAWKALFTAVTVGTGFLGGEVTPLFFIGAALGHALAAPLGLPVPLAAGVGMAAVFAAAANTPLALAIMAVELLGRGALPHVAIVCIVTYALVGRRSIYKGKLGIAKEPAVEALDGDAPA